MIIVIGGIKGGSGKTTIATNLAVMRSCGFGRKLLLVDADEQRSTWDWYQQRTNQIESGDFHRIRTVCMSGKPIHHNLTMMMDEYEDIIVDTGGRDTTSQRSALCVADKLIIPFKPSSIDIWTLGTVKGILDECVNPKLKAYAFINQADPTGKDNEDALELLKEFDNICALDCTIGNRKAFRNAAADGLSIQEMNPLDKKASSEIQKLYDLIYS